MKRSPHLRHAATRIVAFVAVTSLAIPLASSTFASGVSPAVRGSTASSADLPSGPFAVARAIGHTVALYRSPTAAKPYSSLSNPNLETAPLVFLVANYALAPHWVKVYLPERPNDSKAWIKVSSVKLYHDDYLVHANLSTHRLTIYDNNREILSFPVGVGRALLPTPPGTYYLADLLVQPDPTGEYGPYAFGLSAYSTVLEHFGGGPGEIGLHGTNVPSSVGESVSHGCLRVSDPVITRLAALLPLGTPVIITH